MTAPGRAARRGRDRPGPRGGAGRAHAIGTPPRTQLLEVDAAAVERHHADVEAAPGEAGDQESPTAARRRPPRGCGQTNTTLRAPVPRHRAPPRRAGGGRRQHAFGDRPPTVRLHRLAQPRVAAGAQRPPRPPPPAPSGSRGTIAHPGRPRTTSGTSPTATETTGVWQASASFTTTGAPSHSDVITATSAAFIASATRSRDRPSRLAANDAGDARGAAARPSRRRRRPACCTTFERSPRAAGKRTQGPACGQPSARRASARSTGREQVEVDGARDHRSVARRRRLAAITGRDRDRLRTPRDEPATPAAATAPMRRCRGTSSPPACASCEAATAPDRP